MLRDIIVRKRDQILQVAKKYGASDLKIFGSVIRGENTKESDVDILVTLPKIYDMFKQRLPLQNELENIIGKKVDLVVKDELNHLMAQNILNEAQDL